MKLQSAFTLALAAILCTSPGLTAKPNKGGGGSDSGPNRTDGDPNISIPVRNTEDGDKTITFGVDFTTDFNPQEFANLKTEKQREQYRVDNPTLNLITIDGQQFSVNSRIFGTDAFLTRDQRNMLIREVEVGTVLLNELRDGTRTELNPSQLSSIMWALQVKGENQIGANFRKGALTIPDPDGKIREMISKMEGNYERGSSHLRFAQNQTNGRPLGVDFVANDFTSMDYSLPYGNRTVLAQSYTVNGESRLYLKMETKSLSPQTTLREKVEHMKNWAARNDGGLPTTRREDSMPAELGNHQASFLSSLKKTRGKDAISREKLKELTDLLSVKRVHQLQENLPAARVLLNEILSSSFAKEIATPSGTTTLPTPMALKKVDRDLRNNFNNMEATVQAMPDADVRIGNEVVFTSGDLAQN